MREQKILINGLETNFKVAGEGEPLLILHGWGGSSDSWIRVQEILAKKGYKAVVPDFPGFGKSKTPLESWSVTDYVKWVNYFINSQKFEKFFLFGHSFGGRIAIRFTISYPEKVRELILCDSAGIKQKWGKKEKIIFQLAKIGNIIFTSAFLRRFKDSARNLFYIFLRHKDYAKADGTMKETIKKVLDEDLLTDLPQIKVKTLIIWGEKDKLVPVKYAYIFKEKIENSEIKILSRIGHSPHLETPEKLAEIIVRFIKS